MLTKQEMLEINNKLEELGYYTVYNRSKNIIQFTPEHLEERKEGKYWVTDIPKKPISLIEIESRDIIKLTYFPVGVLDKVEKFSCVEELIEFVIEHFPLD